MVFIAQTEGADFVYQWHGNLSPHALDGHHCSMMFGEYENNEARVFYGDDDGVQRVNDQDTFTPDMDFYLGKYQESAETFKTMGTGSKFSTEELSRLMKHVSISHGDLAEFEEQLVTVLKTMKWA